MTDQASPPGEEDTAAALRRAAQRREAGDAAGAAAIYRGLAERHPGEAGVWAMLGDALRIAGDAAAGADALAKAALLAPDDTDIAAEWALALLESGEATAALAALAERETALETSARGQAVLADAYRQAGRPGDAIAPYRRLLDLEPGNINARVSLGVCLQDTGDLSGAIACYEAALAQEPDSAEALTNLGLARSAQGDQDAALKALEHAASLDPENPATQCGLGAVLQKLGRAADAADCFETAIAAAPGDANAWSNLGNARQDQLMLDEALTAHDRAAALAPDDGEVHWNRAMSLLLSGDLTSGFAAYEWRAKTKDHAPPAHGSPRWQGGNASGLRLLLIAEQGFGDAIQFARYAPLMQRRGADISIQCHPKLTGLLETLDGAPKVFATGAPLPPVDAHAPLMSLPHLLGTTLESVPAGIPYLDVASGSEHPPATGGRRRIGLCWTGNPNHPDNPHRSVPFEAFAPFLGNQGIDWRGLQFGPAAEDAAGRLADDPAWTASLDGFGNTAAALQSCDLVITIDTSTAHLAGALGRPVWLLLKYAPDWRWMIGRDDSPWYPTVRLFRQTAPGDWNDVLTRLEAALKTWMEC